MLSQIVQRGSAALRTTKVVKEAHNSPTVVAPVYQAPKVHPYHVAPVSAPSVPTAAPSLAPNTPHLEHTREFHGSHTPRSRHPYSGPHHPRQAHLGPKLASPTIPIPALTNPHSIIGRTNVVGPQHVKPKISTPVPPPTAPEQGMIVEFLGNDGSYRLGLVGARIAGTLDVWEISEKVHDSAVTHEIHTSRITFCWPHFHNSNAYHFSVDHLSALTEQVQQDLERHRTQLLVQYGKWVEGNVTSIKTESLAAALFNQQPRPHDMYVAHRLLQEAEAYVRLGPTHPGTAIVAEYPVKSLQEMSKVSQANSLKQKEVERNLFLHRFARRIWATRPTASAVEANETSSILSPAPITAATLEEYLSVLPELTEAERRLNVHWNPHRDAPFIAELKKFAFANEDTPMAELLHAKATLIAPLNLHYTPEAVFKLLVQVGAVGAYENPHAARFPSKLHWTAADMKVYVPQGITLAHADRDSKNRRDYRGYNSPIFAIDSRSETDEIDDAVSVFRATDGSTWVHIHIADPSRFVNPNDTLDIIARQRVQSVYLPEKTASMFPPNFAKQNFSLLPDKVNYALTFAVKLDPATGQILNYDIAPSLIDKVTALTYDQADDVIVSSQNRTAAKRPMSPTHVAALNTLLELADARRKCRERAGAVVFADQARPEIEVSNAGERVSVHPVRDSESLSRGMVSEFMILVGEVTAMFASRHAIPIPFRSQAKRGEQIVSSASIAAQMAAASSSATSSMPSAATCPTRTRLCPAITNVQPGEHAGLGVKAYCQASSPIRRYTDLLVHHQIKSVLRGETLPFSSAKLSSMICQAESVQAQLNHLAGNSSRYWILRFLERQDRSRQYEALIASDPNPTADYSEFRCSAWLSELGWKTDILLSADQDCPSIGDRVKVFVSNVDAFNDELTLREVAPTAPLMADVHSAGIEVGPHHSSVLQL